MSKPIQLSEHFSSDEFACRHCGQFHVDQRLISALEQLRAKVGPIHITSGYRCPDHNKAIGGAPKSEHVLGRAADIVATRFNLLRLLAEVELVEAFRTSGIGLYPDEGFIHVDVGRPKPARWGRLKGKGYVTLQEALKHVISKK